MQARRSLRFTYHGRSGYLTTALGTEEDQAYKQQGLQQAVWVDTLGG
jgi:hypothetical protein